MKSQIVEINTILPLYNLPIEFYLVTNKQNFLPIIMTELYKKYECEITCDACEGFFVEIDDKNNEHHFIIALPTTSNGKVDIPTLVHEICHMGLAIKKYLGITTSDDGDECLAYFMGGIITQFCNVSNINNYFKLKLNNTEETTDNE